MKTRYRAQFNIDIGQLDDLVRLSHAWLSRSRRIRRLPRDLCQNRTIKDGRNVLTLAAGEYKGAEEFGMKLTHPDKKDPDYLWEVTLASEKRVGRSAFVTIELRNGWEQQTHKKLHNRYDAPGLVRRIINHLPCHSQYNIADSYETMNDGNELFMRIDDDNRLLPIVYLSVNGDGPLIDPNKIQRKIAGIAHVYVAANQGVSELLCQRLESEDCRNGAVEIYWPGDVQDDILLSEVRAQKEQEKVLYRIFYETANYSLRRPARVRFDNIERVNNSKD